MKTLINGTTRVALILAMFTTITFAKVQSASTTQGTIVTVHRSTVATPETTGVGDATDNPLQTEHYTYDISVKTADGFYVGRYESEFDNLSDVLAPNHVVSVRLQNGAMYLDSQAGSLKTTLENRADSGQSWDQAASK